MALKIPATGMMFCIWKCDVTNVIKLADKAITIPVKPDAAPVYSCNRFIRCIRATALRSLMKTYNPP